MRVKFRTRIIILFCIVVFMVCVFVGPPNSRWLGCRSEGTLCLDEGEFEKHQIRDPNVGLMIGMIKNTADQNIRDEGYSKHAFNDLISRRIGSHRAIPDTRHER